MYILLNIFILQGVKTSDLVGQNVRKTVVCVECQKPRCIYAKKQLSVRDARALARLMEKYDYTCGSLITPDGTIKIYLQCILDIQYLFFYNVQVY